ncbi:MAG: hypothetical protein IPJ95_20075 [Gemmatimonadetes bacterium]|nr:hypothetical protein [Gemmatimonadota bacterium]
MAGTTELDRILETLTTLGARDLRGATGRRAAEGAIHSLLEVVNGRDDILREKVRSRMNANMSALLLWFAKERAARAIGLRSSEELQQGFAALALEDFSQDLRDSLTPLALLCHAAARLDVDPVSALRSIEHLASPAAARQIVAFINRPAELRRIEAFDYKEGDGSQPFEFVPSRSD